MGRSLALGAGLSITLASPAAGQGAGKPILDMHLHTTPVTLFGPPPHALCVPVMPPMPAKEPGG